MRLIKVFQILCLLSLCVVSVCVISVGTPANAHEVSMLLRARFDVGHEDFPLSKDETRELMTEVRRLVGNIFSTSAPAELLWKVEGPYLSIYNPFDNKISIPRILGGNVSIYNLNKPVYREKYTNAVKAVLAHEYAHFLLQRQLEEDVKAVRQYFDGLRANQSAVLSEAELNRHMLFIGLHEIFADTVAVLYANDVEALKRALNMAYGTFFGNLWERRFLYPALVSHERNWKRFVGGLENGKYNVDPYSVFWPQRAHIARAIQKGVKANKILKALYEAIKPTAESILLSESDLSLNLRDLNKGFNEDFARDLGEFKNFKRTCSSLF